MPVVFVMGISFAMSEEQREEQRQKSIVKARAAQKRLAEKRQAKLKDPAFQEAQRLKRSSALKKAYDKQNTPEARERRRVKAIAALEAKKNKPKTTKKPKTTSRGLKGRTPTALEKRLMNVIGEQPCIACKKHGVINTAISLHHVDGRTKTHAHAKVLPLCCFHHDTPFSKEQRQSVGYDIFPVHAKGSYGGKAAFEAEYGTQEALLVELYEELGFDIPW